jgi:hypothetical protein
MANLLNCLVNIINNPGNNLQQIVRSNIRINRIGDPLEEYIRNCFANTFGANQQQNILSHSQIFSWLGNQNNPPDLIIRGGDAVEIKKIEGVGDIALNSSHPRSKLPSSSNMITQGCRDCEGAGVNWVKELIYAIGTVRGNTLKYLFFVYGSIYAASDITYEKLESGIKQSVSASPGVSFSSTNEIARVNQVDPLGITYLRVRGMWGIKHPYYVYNYLPSISEQQDRNNTYTINALIPRTTWDSFPGADRSAIIALSNSHLGNPRVVVDYGVKVKNPDNPAILVDAVLVKIINK